jgi:UPF0176 protein
MGAITNISCYQFAPLTGLKPLRERLIARCKTLGLKGTILLSTEGINLFVAGGADAIAMLVSDLKTIPGLENLTPKFSESDHQPFTRMLVRIKKEIIAFGVEGIDPSQRTSPKLSARTLKQWLDEGREITLLDTRNDYEVKLGTFRGARPIGIRHFREFPKAVEKLPPELKTQPVVMFCTGGIRCEKAGPFMEREGFQNIFQLDGGILKYFEECGGAHYDGECFVFDQRVGVDPSLRETDSEQCHSCQTPLTVEDQRSSRYVPGKSCPYCHRTGEEEMAQNIVRRQEAIQRFTVPLPGSRPYENRRPLNVPAAFDGRTLIDFLSGIFSHTPREQWMELCRLGRFVDEQGKTADASRMVRAGERYLHLIPSTVEPPVHAGIQLLYEDEAIVVLHKPAPLPVHPSGRFNRNTLQHILHAVYAPQKPRAAHRLDANTTGILVCARTRYFAGLLQPQFARGEVEKIYLARVQGCPVEERFSCDAPISAMPGELGSREIDEESGLHARTEFRVIHRNHDGTTLLEARPITGRTNQIRVHLWQLGMPVCGDPAYLPGKKLGELQTLPLDAPPLCLHAWQLRFIHPLTRKRVEFSTERPEWSLESLSPPVACGF